VARCGSVSVTAGAQAPAGDAPWVSIFNGRDYSGWEVVGPANLAPAEIEDGAMLLRQRANTAEPTFVTTTKRYGDFILELDLKDDPGFNSGILLRWVEAAADAKVRLNCYEVKIDDTPRAWTGGVFDDFGDSWRWLHDLADNEAGRASMTRRGLPGWRRAERGRGRAQDCARGGCWLSGILKSSTRSTSGGQFPCHGPGD
jgi:hypothetical protein